MASDDTRALHVAIQWSGMNELSERRRVKYGMNLGRVRREDKGVVQLPLSYTIFLFRAAGYIRAFLKFNKYDVRY